MVGAFRSRCHPRFDLRPKVRFSVARLLVRHDVTFRPDSSRQCKELEISPQSKASEAACGRLIPPHPSTSSSQCSKSFQFRCDRGPSQHLLFRITFAPQPSSESAGPIPGFPQARKVYPPARGRVGVVTSSLDSETPQERRRIVYCPRGF